MFRDEFRVEFMYNLKWNSFSLKKRNNGEKCVKTIYFVKEVIF